MRNIASYQPYTVFTGAEISLWCKDQIENHKSHQKIARKLYMHYTFKDKNKYQLVRMQYRMYEPETIGFRRVK